MLPAVDDYLQAPLRHPRFYFPDGNLILQVEQTLYNIHKYFFVRDSNLFSAMFTLPVPTQDTHPDGASDQQSLLLPGVTTLRFDKLLMILYPLSFAKFELESCEDWEHVLELATRFDFSSVRQLAIRHLSPIAPAAEKIHPARLYIVFEWLQPSYVELCRRNTPLTLQEGVRLGVADTIGIGIVRDKIRYPSNFNRDDASIVGMVVGYFDL